jgi:hypothetical protein
MLNAQSRIKFWKRHSTILFFGINCRSTWSTAFPNQPNLIWTIFALTYLSNGELDNVSLKMLWIKYDNATDIFILAESMNIFLFQCAYAYMNLDSTYLNNRIKRFTVVFKVCVIIVFPFCDILLWWNWSGLNFSFELKATHANWFVYYSESKRG